MKKKLIPIAGTPINMLNMPKGCAFSARCDECMKICLEEIPQEIVINSEHKASCWMNIKEMTEQGILPEEYGGELPDCLKLPEGEKNSADSNEGKEGNA